MTGDDFIYKQRCFNLPRDSASFMDVLATSTNVPFNDLSREQSLHSANVQNNEKDVGWDWVSFRAAQRRRNFSKVTSPLHLSTVLSPKVTLLDLWKCVFYHPVDKRGFSEVAFRTTSRKKIDFQIKGKWVRLISVTPSGIQNICVKRVRYSEAVALA